MERNTIAVVDRRLRRDDDDDDDEDNRMLTALSHFANLFAIMVRCMIVTATKQQGERSSTGDGSVMNGSLICRFNIIPQLCTLLSVFSFGYCTSNTPIRLDDLLQQQKMVCFEGVFSMVAKLKPNASARQRHQGSGRIENSCCARMSRCSKMRQRENFFSKIVIHNGKVWFVKHSVKRSTLV